MVALLAEPDTLGVADIPEEAARLALRRASGAIRGYCGWNLLRESASWSDYGDGGSAIYLPTLYLVTVDSLSLYGWGVLDPSIYSPKRDGRILLPFLYQTRGLITVAYTHGYDVNSPEMEHIRGIAAGAATRLVDNPTGRRSQSIGGESWTLATGPLDDPNATLTSGEKAELDAYRMPRV